jgi:hypothetical protein
MAYYNTILNQVAAIIPRHEFEYQAKIHHAGQKFRKFNRWTQFMALMIGQLTARKSLRDIVGNLKAQGHKLYHLGMRPTSRSTLARVNNEQPASLYEKMFFMVLAQCQRFAPKNKFKINEKVYLLDTTTIDLCLSVFPWAKFRKTKGAVKLHMGIDANGYLPTFMTMTDGKTHESQWAKNLKLPKGSYVVFDRGFTDYSWYQSLMESGVFFVARLKKNSIVKHLKKRSGRKSPGVTVDRQIQLGDISEKLRLVSYIDPETGQEYLFVTNAFHLDAKTVAALYKERWQIELFFKWIKQHLKIKTFLGTSRNAVLTQVWVALIVYLLIAFLKFSAKLGISMLKILSLLQLSLFERRNLLALLTSKHEQPPDSPQLLLF